VGQTRPTDEGLATVVHGGGCVAVSMCVI